MLKHSLTEAPYWISDPCKKHIYGKGPYKEHFKSNLLPNTVTCKSVVSLVLCLHGYNTCYL